MKKLLKWIVPGIGFIATIVVFGSSLVMLATTDLPSKARTGFIIMTIASFLLALSFFL
jgi:hypothetical protein